MKGDKDRERFAQVFFVLFEVYGDGEPAKALIDIYWKTLEPYRIDEVEVAAQEILKSRKYNGMPKPAEIILLIEGESEDKALGAWNETIKALHRHGHYRSIRFSDPVIHGAIEAMGGWLKCGDWEEKELTWKQKEFLQQYRIQSRNKELPDYLPGRYEIESLSGKGERLKEGAVNPFLIDLSGKSSLMLPSNMPEKG